MSSDKSKKYACMFVGALKTINWLRYSKKEVYFFLYPTTISKKFLMRNVLCSSAVGKTKEDGILVNFHQCHFTDTETLDE
jgi:hypothetical protein